MKSLCLIILNVSFRQQVEKGNGIDSHLPFTSNLISLRIFGAWKNTTPQKPKDKTPCLSSVLFLCFWIHFPLKLCFQLSDYNISNPRGKWKELDHEHLNNYQLGATQIFFIRMKNSHSIPSFLIVFLKIICRYQTVFLNLLI